MGKWVDPQGLTNSHLPIARFSSYVVLRSTEVTLHIIITLDHIKFIGKDVHQKIYTLATSDVHAHAYPRTGNYHHSSWR